MLAILFAFLFGILFAVLLMFFIVNFLLSSKIQKNNAFIASLDAATQEMARAVEEQHRALDEHSVASTLPPPVSPPKPAVTATPKLVQKTSNHQTLRPDVEQYTIETLPVLRAGLMKIRGSLKVWRMRYFVLTPGMLIYYKKKSMEATYGLIMLHNCKVNFRNTKKRDGLCFMVFNPDGKAVYSTKSLRGHTLSSAKYGMGRMDQAIFRVDPEEAHEWVDSIKQGIHLAPRSAQLLSRLSRIKWESTAADLSDDDDDDGGDSSEEEHADDADDMRVSDASTSDAVGHSSPNLTYLELAKQNGRKIDDTVRYVAPTPSDPSLGAEGAPSLEGAPEKHEGASEMSSQTDDKKRDGNVYESKEERSPELGLDFYVDGSLEILGEDGQWEQRWFVLRRGLVVIFNREESSDCIAMINLEGCGVRFWNGMLDKGLGSTMTRVKSTEDLEGAKEEDGHDNTGSSLEHSAEGSGEDVGGVSSPADDKTGGNVGVEAHNGAHDVTADEPSTGRTSTGQSQLIQSDPPDIRVRSSTGHGEALVEVKRSNPKQIKHRRSRSNDLGVRWNMLEIESPLFEKKKTHRHRRTRSDEDVGTPPNDMELVPLETDKRNSDDSFSAIGADSEDDSEADDSSSSSESEDEGEGDADGNSSRSSMTSEEKKKAKEERKRQKKLERARKRERRREIKLEKKLRSEQAKRERREREEREKQLRKEKKMKKKDAKEAPGVPSCDYAADDEGGQRCVDTKLKRGSKDESNESDAKEQKKDSTREAPRVELEAKHVKKERTKEEAKADLAKQQKKERAKEEAKVEAEGKQQKKERAKEEARTEAVAKQQKKERAKEEAQSENDSKQLKKERAKELKAIGKQEKAQEKERAKEVKAQEKLRSKLVKERAKDIKAMEKEKEKLARERKELSHAENTFEIYHLQKKPIYILLPSFQRAADPATTGGKKTAKKEATKKSEKAVTFDASTMADVDALQGPEPPPPEEERPFFRITSHRCVLRAKSGADMDYWMDNILRAISIPFKAFPCTLPVFTDLPNQPGESCEWLNIMFRRYFKEMRSSTRMHEVFQEWLQVRFDKMKQQSFMGPVTVQQVDLGSEFVQFNNVKLATSDVMDEVVGEFEMTYNGGINVTVTNDLYVNWPTTKFATIPCIAFVQLVSLRGIVRVYAPPEAFGRFSAAFVQQPQTKFNFKMVVGSRRYQVHTLFPRVSELIESTLRKLLYKTLVIPNKITFALPVPGNKMRMKVEKLSSRRSRARRQLEREAEQKKREEAERHAADGGAGLEERAAPITTPNGPSPATQRRANDVRLGFDEGGEGKAAPKWAKAVVEEMQSTRTW